MLKMLCNNNDIVNDTMKPFRINTEKGVLVGKINERLFVCDIAVHIKAPFSLKVN
jgi:hypothetical protein